MKAYIPKDQRAHAVRFVGCNWDEVVEMLEALLPAGSIRWSEWDGEYSLLVTEGHHWQELYEGNWAVVSGLTLEILSDAKFNARYWEV